MKKHFWQILSIIVLGSLLISVIFHSGWYTSHDGVYHILRTEEALRMLKLGQFPLRWAGTIDQGFGLPLFNFIYPLPYYLSAIFSFFVGSVWAVKLVIIFSYVFGGIGIYFLTGQKNRLVGLSLALIYLMTPYQFLNIFVRGALGEILALGLMPWVLLSFSSLAKTDASLKWYHPLPLALLLLSHNFLGILFLVFLFGYTVFQSQNRARLFVSFSLSVGLATFFLLPMYLERSLLYSLDNQFFTFRFDQHFVYLKQLLYSKWNFWYSVPGPDDGMSFQLGFAQIVIAGLGILAIIFSKKHPLASLYLILAYTGSLFLTTQHSTLIWEKFSILQTVQFPWRLLFMSAILTPVLGSYFFNRLTSKKITTIFLILVLSLGFWNVRNYRRPMKLFTPSEYTDLYLLNQGKSTTTFRTEILPKWSVPNERYKSEEIQVNSGNMTIDALKFDAVSLTTTINNKPDQSSPKVTVLRNYYPGWVAVMDGKKRIELTPSQEGMIQFSPELGVHTYQIKIKSTLVEVIANLISLISIIIIFSLWQKNRNQKL